jgi:nicotinate-nucleotide pyrophosphorylase (carboxylating)
LGDGDVTTTATIPPDLQTTAHLVAKQPCVVAGLDVAAAVFRAVDKSLRLEVVTPDGTRCAAGDELARVHGSAAWILSAERTALNFLQHLSGIATLTAAFVDAAAGRVAIYDTRKTVPGLRALAKYAVRCGGGTNHRAGLYDGVLIKDNHVRVSGGIVAAVARMRDARRDLPIEVETQSLAEVDDAIAAAADVIMLDNLSDDEMREAVKRIGGRAVVEVSGGVTLERVPAMAALGVGRISVGALTHSAPAVDISLEMGFEAKAPAS